MRTLKEIRTLTEANFRYFATHNGEVVRLDKVHHDGHISTKAHHFTGLTPDGTRVTAERAIEFKSNPSLHKCDARCTNAKGFKCECSCGGKNHGKG
jgi:hypothetical protein